MCSCRGGLRRREGTPRNRSARGYSCSSCASSFMADTSTPRANSKGRTKQPTCANPGVDRSAIARALNDAAIFGEHGFLRSVSRAVEPELVAVRINYVDAPQSVADGWPLRNVNAARFELEIESQRILALEIDRHARAQVRRDRGDLPFEEDVVLAFLAK